MIQTDPLTSLQNGIALPSPSDPSWVDSMMDDQYYMLLKGTAAGREDNQGNYDYSSLSNLGMIYLYVHNRDRDRKQNTIRVYLRELLNFLHYVQSIDINDIRELSRFDMEIYQKQLETQYSSQYTIARKIVIIQSFLKWCFDESYFTKNIARGLKPKTPNNDEIPERDIAVYDLKEAIRFYNENPKVQSLLLLLGSTGLRLNEVITPKWRDLYYDRGDQKFYLKTWTKRNKIRHARIKEEVLAVLKEYRLRVGLSAELDMADASPFYPNRYGKHYSLSSLSTYLSSCMSAAGLTTIQGNRVTPHFLRHAFAQQASANGAPLEWISETLGHQNPKITKDNYLSRQLKKEHDVSDFIDL